MILRTAFLAALLIGLLQPAWALDAGKLGGAAPSTVRPAAAPSDEVNRDAIAVIIGNRTYANGLPNVDYAENDARAVRDFVINVLGYRVGNVIELRNASQAEILSVFGNEADHRGKLWSWIKPGLSDVFVYYSGHGVPGLRDRRGYLLPVDADPATPEINGYSLDLLFANLTKLDVRSAVVMLEACFSGNSAAGWLIGSASPVYVRTELPKGPLGLTVISAAAGDQVASWDRQARLGLFTRHVLDALRAGKADAGRGGNGDGAVTLSELEAYLNDEMTYAARRQFRRVQVASVLGDPRTVLVPEVLRAPPPPARVVRAPAAPPVPAPVPAPAPEPVPVERKYPLPGATVEEGRSFVFRYWSEIRESILEYYESDGKSWDYRGGKGAFEQAEQIEAIAGWRVVAVAADRLDMVIDYRWSGGGRGLRASANVRVRVAPDGFVIEKFWR